MRTKEWGRREGGWKHLEPVTWSRKYGGRGRSVFALRSPWQDSTPCLLPCSLRAPSVPLPALPCLPALPACLLACLSLNTILQGVSDGCLDAEKAAHNPTCCRLCRSSSKRMLPACAYVPLHTSCPFSSPFLVLTDMPHATCGSPSPLPLAVLYRYLSWVRYRIICSPPPPSPSTEFGPLQLSFHRVCVCSTFMNADRPLFPSGCTGACGQLVIESGGGGGCSREAGAGRGTRDIEDAVRSVSLGPVA